MKSNRYICFSLGSEEFAIPLLSVKEVIAVPEFTPVPFTPSFFVGIMNLRGQIISVIDLRQKFGIKPQNNLETAVIICDLNSLFIGIIVDSINNVISPSEEEISEKPEIKSDRPSDYITGVYRKDKRLILFLDISKTLNVEEKRILQKTVSGQQKLAAS